MHRHADVVAVHGYANALGAYQGFDNALSIIAFPQAQLQVLPNATWAGAYTPPLFSST